MTSTGAMGGGLNSSFVTLRRSFGWTTFSSLAIARVPGCAPSGTSVGSTADSSHPWLGLSFSWGPFQFDLFLAPMLYPVSYGSMPWGLSPSLG